MQGASAKRDRARRNQMGAIIASAHTTEFNSREQRAGHGNYGRGQEEAASGDHAGCSRKQMSEADVSLMCGAKLILTNAQ